MFTQIDPPDQTDRPYALMVVQDAQSGEILGAFTVVRTTAVATVRDSTAQQR